MVAAAADVAPRWREKMSQRSVRSDQRSPAQLGATMRAGVIREDDDLEGMGSHRCSSSSCCSELASSLPLPPPEATALVPTLAAASASGKMKSSKRVIGGSTPSITRYRRSSRGQSRCPVLFMRRRRLPFRDRDHHPSSVASELPLRARVCPQPSRTGAHHREPVGPVRHGAVLDPGSAGDWWTSATTLPLVGGRSSR